MVRSSAAGQPGELARITGERAEALTQQTATSQLLAINSSRVAELEPILRAILEKAKLSISGAPAAYSHAELGEKDLRLGSVLVFCNGVSISGLDKSMSNQAIESPPFICIQIFGALHAPSANDVAKDRQFLVVDDDAFCHLTAPTTFNRPPKNYSSAVHAIRRWWTSMGKKRHPDATRLMISADGGGSNGYRVRLWKVELQKLANELKLPITVCHLPPGASKWNKIEHRLFSFISINWRGKPLRSYRTIVQLIAATTTDAGLKVRAELDESKYPKGVKVSDAELAAIRLKPHSFHGDWNYTIMPIVERLRSPKKK